MTAVETNPRYEVARWAAAPLWELLEERGITRADLRELNPPIYVKRDRERLTTQIADRIACEVLRVHPIAVWPDWMDDYLNDTDQEQLALWAS